MLPPEASQRPQCTRTYHLSLRAVVATLRCPRRIRAHASFSVLHPVSVELALVHWEASSRVHQRLVVAEQTGRQQTACMQVQACPGQIKYCRKRKRIPGGYSGVLQR